MPEEHSEILTAVALADFDQLVEILGKAPHGVRSQIRSFPDETHTTLPLLGEIDALF